MRYLFRGLIRESGKPVVGHVEAAYPEEAFNALGENGIVTESLTPDPKPTFGTPSAGDRNAGQGGGEQPNVADAIDSALDVSASQVNFDDLTERYRGKRVWVIDRDKIRRRVAQVVDQALTIAQQQSNTADQVRESVAKAIEGLFKDNANITSPANQVAAQQAAAAGGGVASPQLEMKVDSLTKSVGQIQTAIANLSALVRNLPAGGFGGGGGAGGPRRQRSRAQRPQQNEVLLEIFRANMKLQRGVDMPAPGETPAPSGETPAAESAAPPDDTSLAEAAPPADSAAAGAMASGDAPADDEQRA